MEDKDSESGDSESEDGSEFEPESSESAVEEDSEEVCPHSLSFCGTTNTINSLLQITFYCKIILNTTNIKLGFLLPQLYISISPLFRS